MNTKTMKIVLSGLMALAMSALVCASADNSFALKGSILGLPDSMRVVVADVEDPNGEIRNLASAFAKDGAFALSGTVSSPTMCKLLFQRKLSGDEGYRNVISLPLIVESGSISLSSPVNYDSLRNSLNLERIVRIDGGKAQAEYAEYVAHVAELKLKADEAGYMSARKYFETNNNEDSVLKYDRLKKKAAAEFAARRSEFIAAHPDYNISAYLTQKELEKQFAYTADEIDAMAALVKACPDTARTATVDRRRNFAHKYALKRQCPEFDVTNVDGSVLPFASLITPGKYTFIDFWASWCGPCRSAIPHVRELYNKYGDKLAVFSISVDEKEAPWRKAMEQEKMEWTQLHLDAGDQMAKAAKAFFLTSIPRLILLNDKCEVICSSNLPRELSACLEKELGK